MGRSAGSPNFSEYRTVGEAAEYLGVSAATLRNWDRAGKLKPRRHPQNGYRIYLHADLEAILNSVEHRDENDNAASATNWNAIGDSEHFVQYYEHDSFLVSSVAGFMDAALAHGYGGIIIAADGHRRAIHERVSAGGIDVSDALISGRLVSLDASQVLSQIMIGDLPDSRRFNDVLGSIVSRLATSHQRVHAFGEMVALLWSAGNHAAAVRLEELWNELRAKHRICVLCAYPIADFCGSDAVDDFNRICECHSGVIPTESYATVPTFDEHGRAIAALQQQAQSLKAEITHRQQLEQDLKEADRNKAELLSDLGFRLRSPIGEISSAIHALRQDPANGQAINTLDHQVRQLTQLLAELPTPS